MSGAQTASNEATARTQATLNNVNQVTPYGNVSYSQDQSNPDHWTQTTSLSPQEQQLFNSQIGAEQQAVNIGSDQLGRISSALGGGLTPGSMVHGVGNQQLRDQFNYSPAQTSFDQGPAINNSFAQSGPLQNSFDPGQQVQGGVNSGDFNQTVQNAQNAVYRQATSRLDPQWAQAQEQQQASLVAQGLGPNSTAYQTAMDNFNRSKTDAYNQANFSAVQAGLGAQQQGYGQALQSGQFANAAAGQEYAQNQGQAGFANTAQQQQFGQDQSRAQFGNDAAGQAFGQNLGAAQFGNAGAGQNYSQNMGANDFYNTAQNQGIQNQIATGTFTNQAQQQALEQQAYLQNQPINQFSALMGLGQVQGPQAIQYTPSQVAPTNVLGAYQLNSDAQQSAYQSKMGAYGSALGGLFNLGGAGVMKFSDRRLKRDIHESGRRGPLKLYIYRMRDEEGWREGVMAQDVESTRPDCVARDPNGWLMVDYGRLAA